MFVEGQSPSTNIRSRFPLHPSLSAMDGASIEGEGEGATTEPDVKSLLTGSVFIDNLLDSAHFAGLKTHFDAMRMTGGTGQDILHDSSRSFSGALILFLDDVNLDPRFYIFSVLAVHAFFIDPRPHWSAGVAKRR
jgi:hypothetical protein